MNNTSASCYIQPRSRTKNKNDHLDPASVTNPSSSSIYARVVGGGSDFCAQVLFLESLFLCTGIF